MKNILTLEELKILKFFGAHLFEEYSTREIGAKLNKKSYGWVFNAVEKLKKMGILTLRENSLILCYLHLT